MGGDFFDYINQVTGEIVNNEEKFKLFLQFLARERSNHTMANKLLIWKSCPNAVDVRTAEEWETVGIGITKADEVIHSIRYWGRKYGFSVCTEYDLSATTAAGWEYPSRALPPDFVAEYMLARPVIKTEFCKEGSKIRALYEPERKVIAYTSGFKSYEEICARFFREFAHYYFHQDDYRVFCHRRGMTGSYNYTPGKYENAAEITEYLLEHRYGIRLRSLPTIKESMDLPSCRILLQMAYHAAERIGAFIDKSAEMMNGG